MTQCSNLFKQQARRLDGGLSSSRGHNERPSWTAEHNRSRSNGNAYRLRSREAPEIVFYRSVFGILTFCFAEFHTSVICHAVFMLCLGSCLLQNMSLNVGFQSEGRSLKYSVSMSQRKVDNRKPQAGGHVTGLCRRSISGRNDLFLSFPTGVLSLPLAARVFIFSRALFCTVPWLTERLEEATRIANHAATLCKECEIKSLTTQTLSQLWITQSLLFPILTVSG